MRVGCGKEGVEIGFGSGREGGGRWGEEDEGRDLG